MPTIHFQIESTSARLSAMGDDIWAVSNLFSRDRGRGLARQLMEQIIAYADERNYTLTLSVSRFFYKDGQSPDNDGLEAFYESLGFERMGNTKPIFMRRLSRSQALHGP